MKILCLTRYDKMGASSRMRFYQYYSSSEFSGVKIISQPFITDSMLKHKYLFGYYKISSLIYSYIKRIFILLFQSKNFQAFWIEKEALPWIPSFIERMLLSNKIYILDFDYAVFHYSDMVSNSFVLFFYGNRIDILMRDADLVVAGNNYLANRAILADANRVEIIPTVIDIARYHIGREKFISAIPIIVWIGSPSTLQYLDELAEPLRLLAMKQDFILRTIGSGIFDMPGVSIECHDWSIDNEADLIAMCDIGIMPLKHGAWEQGKCAYKLIQYMACGLPTVASPIGANLEVVVDGSTGFFASKASDWLEKLELLLTDEMLRSRLGLAGRARVEENYCLQQTAPKLMSLLNEIIDH